MNRKNFIYSLVRVLIFSVITGIMAFLFSRNKVSAAGCEENRFCKGCGKFTSCAKPQAEKQRKYDKR